MSDLLPASSTAPPVTPVAELAIGRMTKEQKRNIRRAIGEVASRAIDDCRAMAYEVYTQQSALAKELVVLQRDTPSMANALHTRVDGVAAWCEKNEAAAAALALQVKALENVSDQTRNSLAILDRMSAAETIDLRRRLSTLEQLQDAHIQETMRFYRMTFWQRLRWLLGGTMPGLTAMPPASWIAPASWKPQTVEEREAFAADIGRP